MGNELSEFNAGDNRVMTDLTYAVPTRGNRNTPSLLYYNETG